MSRKAPKLEPLILERGLLSAGEDCAPYDMELVATQEGITVLADGQEVLSVDWKKVVGAVVVGAPKPVIPPRESMQKALKRSRRRLA